MLRRISVSLVLALAFTSVALAAPFTNGSFEESPIANTAAGYDILGPGSTALPGWQVVRTIDHIERYWISADGLRSLDLNGDDFEGEIVQEFDTLPDTWYLIRFAVAGNPQGGPDTKSLRVAWRTREGDGTGNLGAQRQVDFTQALDASQGNMGWTYYEFSFYSLGPLSSLRFTSLTHDQRYGPALDDVMVTALPEPSSMALLGTGLVAVACRHRRRRHQRVIE